MKEHHDQNIIEDNRRLRRAVDELTTLNDLARAIAALRDSQEVMDTIIRRSMKVVHAEQGVITLVDRTEERAMKTLVRAAGSSTEHEQFHMNQNLLGWMHINKKPLVVNDPGNDNRFRGVNWHESIRCLLCVPLLVKSEMIGALTLYNKKEERTFSEEDQRLLAIIAGQSAQVVENSRLYEEEKEYFRMQDEVKVASQIQMGLLPKTPPQISGYDIAGKSIPAQLVGGDYFDFIRIDDDRLAVCLGDVTGKGMPAALLMANLQATIRGHTLMDLSPKECAFRANNLLVQSTDLGKFATLFYGILNSVEHTICFSNAGHDYPCLLSQTREPSRLATGGIPLGFVADSVYVEEVVPFNPGSCLIIYSDGITEAMNTQDEEFGEHRICELVLDYKDDSAAQLLERILDAATDFSSGAPMRDDMTLVVVKREKG